MAFIYEKIEKTGGSGRRKEEVEKGKEGKKRKEEE